MLEKTLKNIRAAWNFVIDVIFPPSAEEVLLRTLSYQQFVEKVPKAPPVAFPFISAIFAYKNPLAAELVWEIKNKKNKHALKIGARAIYRKLLEMNLEKAILVPIPISKKRRHERGYNQCELLIDEIMKMDTNNQFEKRFDILFRTKHTEKKQAFKNRSERMENAEQIFKAVKIDVLLDQKILIIDDVVTTGSTVKAARDILIAAGYRNVLVVAVAH